MDGFGSGSRVIDSSGLQGLEPLGADSSGNAIFDASQYSFFGGDAVEEVELGGLEDEDGNGQVDYDEEEFQMDKEEGSILDSLSEMDDLSSTFSKLNSVGNGPVNPDYGGFWGSREGSSAYASAQNADFSNWIDQRPFDAEYSSESRANSSQSHPLLPQLTESNALHRTSSYPEQQQLLNQQKILRQRMSEPVLIPRPSFTSYPPPGGISTQASPSQQPVTLPNLPPFGHSHLEQIGLPPGSQFVRNLPQLPHGSPVNSHAQNQWPNQGGPYRGNPSMHNNYMPRRMPQQNGLLHPQRPQHLQLARSPHHQSAFGPVSGLQSSFGPNFSPPPNFDIRGLHDVRDPRTMHVPRVDQLPHFSYHAADPGFARGDFGWSRFRSKYMTSSELENILRMQLVATHSSDPYVEDYYHQACLARKSDGANFKHHFCPTALRDGSSKPRAANEPHAFLQVDALGRVSFSSIRRPRPLLEVDSPNPSSTAAESKLPQKPLEQEPLLAARVTIEDGISFLLDVDDIDRYLQFNQLPDGGAQLRQRRQFLLEELASSLHLADPLMKSGQQMNMSPNEDLAFLRIVSLPKGRKLLLKFLQLILPGELTRVVCMAIFRNLRFLFGTLPADTEASLIIRRIAETVSSCIQKMDLKSLASCLASVVCSTEHPPLRPIGSLSGDGASVILKSVLEQATGLLTDPQTSGNISVPIRSFWQASFNAFFGLLTKYCSNKYDSVVQTFLAHGAIDSSAIVSDVAKAINKEMPVELLRASLPHTSEQQRKVLLEFSQRSMSLSEH